MSQNNQSLYNRVLVTGANGLLGQALVARLSADLHYDVLATARDDSLRDPRASCGYTRLDITDMSEVRRVIEDFIPHVVVNCAAMTQVDRCETEREACWKVNVDAVKYIARCCRATGSRLVHVSTDFVFDGKNGLYRETDRPSPISFYGKSKLASENVARDAGEQRWTVVRTILVYGTGHRLTRSNFVLWVYHQLKTRAEIRVVTDQWRTPTYVPDLAGAIERIVGTRRTGLYHVSGDELTSIHDFAKTIADVYELDETLIRPTDTEALSQTAARPTKTGFVLDKARIDLAYAPHTIRQALRLMQPRIENAVAALR